MVVAITFECVMLSNFSCPDANPSTISSNEIITEVAEIFPNKVSLNQPDWIILIEVLGNETGISILKNDGMFSLDKAKRMSD